MYKNTHTHTYALSQTHIPTEKEIDFFRTRLDQKAYYNWFVNVAHTPTHTLKHMHTDTPALANTHLFPVCIS